MPNSLIHAPSEQDANWWRGAVIYQIYPRSFQDSNGDGVGDLPGIVRRLEHIASLGVDAIWISPFFASPMKDFGYDVSDYRDVHPMFGTLADFDALLSRAHQLGLKVMIDLALSHTSDQHEWFADSRRSKDSPRADWYVWSNPKPDGTPPNNWLSVFGGPAWQWDGRRQQYYLHNFLASQPDLNFHCPQVQDALLDVARFWLDRGVDGFRLDTINFYFHDKQLRDNPPLLPEKRNDRIAPSVNPYNHQNHLHSKNQPENLEFLRRFRALLDDYEGRACLGEVGDAQHGIEILGQYTQGDDKAHMCYAFELMKSAPATADWIVNIFDRLNAHAPDGWACWAYSNHDVMRHRTRWKLGDEAYRCYAVLLMALRGSACLFQGEELGLEEADVPFDLLQDPYGIEFWPEFKGRDGCRTPMVWQDDDGFGGFSDATPWLPIGAGHLAKSVALQEGKEDTILNHYRRAISLRRTMPVLRTGAQIDMQADGPLLRFTRIADRQELLCLFNLEEDEREIRCPSGSWQIVADAADATGAALQQTIRLRGWHYIIAQKTD